MIASSRLVKGVALLLATSAHAALALAVLPTQGVEMAGQSGAATARIGTSFADMAAGTLSPVESDEIADRTRPEAAPPPPTGRMEPRPAVAQASPRPVPVTAVPVPTASAARPAPDPVVQPAPTATAPAPDPVLRPTDAASEALQPSPQEAEAPPPPPDVQQALPETPPPELAEARPRARPERPPEAAAPEPQRAQTRPAPQGNAETTARAGQVDGSEAAQAVATGAAGPSRDAGNAARSNYPGEVMRTLSRVARPKVSTRGAAIVSFRIAPNGGLAAVQVTRPSGSAELDRAALQVVRAAAPFPAPPAGARTSFSIEIKGR